MLTHTSGLSYDFLETPVAAMYRNANVIGVAPGSSQPNLKVWSEALAKLPLVAQPDEQWNYSVGMDLLGRLVEVISGQSFGRFLQQRVFTPLRMIDTGFHVADDKLERFAANYHPNPSGGMLLADDPQTSPYRQPPALEMGGSGLVGTVGDYLNFAQMLANKGEYQGARRSDHAFLGRPSRGFDRHRAHTVTSGRHLPSARTDASAYLSGDY